MIYERSEIIAVVFVPQGERRRDTMRKVVLQEFISVDGLIADPNDSVDFIPASTRGDPSFSQNR